MQVKQDQASSDMEEIMCLKGDRKVSKTEHEQTCMVYINLLQLNKVSFVPLLSGTDESRGLLKNEEGR